MLKLKNLSKTKLEQIALTVLIIVTIFLRFTNLSYSDYIQDEVSTFFYWGGQKNIEMSKVEFLLNEQKGPLQYLVSYIPFSIVGNYDNELAQRLPFTIFGTFSIIVFYYLVKKITKSTFVSLVSAFLLSINGLIVAYGRIAQYQNLLFFFSFSSLYFYSDLLNPKITNKKALKSSIIGTVLLCLAIYSHWDAFFVIAPIIYIFIKFLKNKKVERQIKFKIVAANFLLGSLILLPFFVPFVAGQINNARNVGHVQYIVGFGAPFYERTDIMQFKLYNPFLTFYLYLVFGGLGVYLSRKFPIFSVWFITNFLIFRFFISYSGLHFYNIFIPVTVLVAFSFKKLLESEFHLFKFSASALLVFSFAFLFLQSYLVFIDHKVEYPMEQERILFWKTRKYSHEDRIRHKTGFPHKRYWKEINDFVMMQNKINGEQFGYFTNEDKGIARIYMKTNEVTGDYFYAVGVKRPLSFANDYKFPQFNPKSTVHKIQNEYGTTVVRIYRVEKRK